MSSGGGSVDRNDRWACKGKGTESSGYINSFFPLHGYKCSLFIGLNYFMTEFITMPLNCYSILLEYSTASLSFVGQSYHTVSE